MKLVQMIRLLGWEEKAHGISTFIGYMFNSDMNVKVVCPKRCGTYCDLLFVPVALRIFLSHWSHFHNYPLIFIILLNSRDSGPICL